MIAFALRRVAHAVPLLLGVVFVVFLVMQLTPGDPVQALVGQYPAPAEYRQQLAAEYHLNAPVWTRFWYFLVNLVHGRLGYSFAGHLPVTSLIFERLPRTMMLAAAAYILGIGFGLVLGVIAATSRFRAVDSAVNAAVLVGYGIPSFFLGQVLVIIFAVKLGWFPTQGMGPYISTGGVSAVERLRYLALPAVTYAVYEVARVVRMTRIGVLETLGQNYVFTAQLKGLSFGQIVRRHVLRNAVLPLTTTMGYSFAVAMGGDVLIETVFSWPGIGLLLVNSIEVHDNQVVVGIVLTIGVMVILMNLIVDLLYAWLDPRVRAVR